MKSPFLEFVRQAIHVRHYSIRTERSYLRWIVRFIHFHGKQHPNHLGAEHVSAFLTHLAVERNVAPNTQAQALNALVFMFKQVLQKDLSEQLGFTRTKKKAKIPVHLERDKLNAIAIKSQGEHFSPFSGMGIPFIAF